MSENVQLVNGNVLPFSNGTFCFFSLSLSIDGYEHFSLMVCDEKFGDLFKTSWLPFCRMFRFVFVCSTVSICLFAFFIRCSERLSRPLAGIHHEKLTECLWISFVCLQLFVGCFFLARNRAMLFIVA